MSADNLAGKTKYNKYKFHKEDLAYLFGVYLGDGCCYNKSSFSIASEDKDVIERTSEIIYNEFGNNFINQSWQLVLLNTPKI